MKERIEIELLISLYKQEHELFIKNEYCRAKHEYEMLRLYKDKLSVLRDSGFQHENFAWLKRMSEIIQNDVDEVRKKMSQLEPILDEAQGRGGYICEYETRLKKMEVLEKLIKERFHLSPVFKEDRLVFEPLK